jgi:hypothetical protein
LEASSLLLLLLLLRRRGLEAAACKLGRRTPSSGREGRSARPGSGWLRRGRRSGREVLGRWAEDRGPPDGGEGDARWRTEAGGDEGEWETNWRGMGCLKKPILEALKKSAKATRLAHSVRSLIFRLHSTSQTSYVRVWRMM